MQFQNPAFHGFTSTDHSLSPAQWTSGHVRARVILGLPRQKQRTQKQRTQHEPASTVLIGIQYAMLWYLIVFEFLERTGHASLAHFSSSSEH